MGKGYVSFRRSTDGRAIKRWCLNPPFRFSQALRISCLMASGLSWDHSMGIVAHATIRSRKS